MRDQKLLRSFCSVQNYQNRMNHDSFNNQHMEIAQENEDEDLNCKAVFDLNWSHDGTVIAAGIEKQVVMLDINQIFSTPIESLLNQQNLLENDYENQVMHSTMKNQNNIQNQQISSSI